MNYLRKHKLLNVQFLVVSTIILMITIPLKSEVFAQSINCPPGETSQTDTASNYTLCCPPNQVVQDSSMSCCPGTSHTASGTSCLVSKYINPVINLLSGAVGLLAVIAIIIGAIEYSTSAGDPQRANSGKQHIINALLGLLAYFLLYAFLQFLLPGGLLHG